jgi:hypothetical protein
MRNGCPPLSGQGVILPIIKRAYERSALRKKADKPRWYRGNFIIEIFVLSDIRLMPSVAEDFCFLDSYCNAYIQILIWRAGKTRGSSGLPPKFEPRSSHDLVHGRHSASPKSGRTSFVEECAAKILGFIGSLPLRIPPCGGRRLTSARTSAGALFCRGSYPQIAVFRRCYSFLA